MWCTICGVRVFVLINIRYNSKYFKKYDKQLNENFELQSNSDDGIEFDRNIHIK